MFLRNVFFGEEADASRGFVDLDSSQIRFLHLRNLFLLLYERISRHKQGIKDRDEVENGSCHHGNIMRDTRW